MSFSKSVQDKDAVKNPEWLSCLLKKTFFRSCDKHDGSRNDLNKYCIDCDLQVCRHCIDADSHSQHKQLKIYRHVYRDVVILKDMQKYLDCSKIQAYKSNKQQVIALKPLPHSGAQISDETACTTCKRRLLDPAANSYCSITCKVQGFMTKEKHSDPPFLSLPSLKKQRRPRKLTPRRAPLQ